MSQTSPSARYSPTMITLHWLTFLLVVVAYATMEFDDVFGRGSAGREIMKVTHYSIGLTILGLAVARLAIRFLGRPTPAIVPTPARLQELAARATHVALYGFLIAMPLIGWATMSTGADPVPFFFGLEVPPLLGPNKALSGGLEELHETLGAIGYALIGLHALASLVHHRIMKDNTLIRMMPGRPRTAG